MKLWVIYALISTVFAGLTAVIAKAGLKNVTSDTGLAVRVLTVFLLIWLNVLFFDKLGDFKKLTWTDVGLLSISGVMTSLSWIFYYKAIKIGVVSQVALIDKFSILITLFISILFLNEQFTWKVGLGAGLIMAGVIIIALK